VSDVGEVEPPVLGVILESLKLGFELLGESSNCGLWCCNCGYTLAGVRVVADNAVLMGDSVLPSAQKSELVDLLLSPEDITAVCGCGIELAWTTCLSMKEGDGRGSLNAGSLRCATDGRFNNSPGGVDRSRESLDCSDVIRAP